MKKWEIQGGGQEMALAIGKNVMLITTIVTGFAKRGLPHTSNLLTLTISKFTLVKAIDLKFGKQEAPT